MNATAIHRQSDPVIELALTIVTWPVPNGKEKYTGPVKRMKLTRGDVSLCRRIYGRALYHCIHCTQ